jgi:hypothetical protein
MTKNTSRGSVDNKLKSDVGNHYACRRPTVLLPRSYPAPYRPLYWPVNPAVNPAAPPKHQGIKESRNQGIKESRNQGIKESRNQGVIANSPARHANKASWLTRNKSKRYSRALSAPKQTITEHTLTASVLASVHAISKVVSGIKIMRLAQQCQPWRFAHLQSI